MIKGRSKVINILALPEDCISHILALTSPGDLCRCAMVSTEFRSTAQSNVVWSQFLPSCLDEILSGFVFTSKKDLYFQLCSSGILVDGSNSKCVGLDMSGKIWCILGPGELSISWNQYDSPADLDSSGQMMLTLPDYKPVASRFLEMPRIDDIDQLFIEAKIKLRFLSPNTRYVAYFIYVPRFKEFVCPPFKVSVRVVGEETRTKNAYLVDDFIPRLQYEDSHPKKRDDGWTEVEMGEFFTDHLDHHDHDHDDREVEICLWDIGEYDDVVCGLVVQGIELRPN